MSLVDYQSSSDESEDEEPKKLPTPEKSIIDSSKKKEPVKISIPSFADVDEEEDESESPSKKCKVSTTAGLLGMLPAPKHSTLGKGSSLTPYVLTKKKEPSQVQKKNPAKPPLPSFKRTSETEVSSSTTETTLSVNSDFFSLQSSMDDIPLPSEKPVMFKSLPIPVTSAFTSKSELATQSSPFSLVSSSSAPSSSVSQDASYIKDYAHPQRFDIAQNSNSQYEFSAENQVAAADEPEDIMNDERFRRLQGKRGKEEINIIDIDLAQELPNKTEWHTKSLTEEKISHSRNRHHMPTQQQKRKHQITYLAFQAKERELDLKNQWAQNRLTKRETQAKYGF